MRCRLLAVSRTPTSRTNPLELTLVRTGLHHSGASLDSTSKPSNAEPRRPYGNGLALKTLERAATLATSTKSSQGERRVIRTERFHESTICASITPTTP